MEALKMDTSKKSIRAYNTLRIIGKIVIYFFLIAWGVIVLFPFYFMVITSFKEFATYAYTFMLCTQPLITIEVLG